MLTAHQYQLSKKTKAFSLVLLASLVFSQLAAENLLVVDSVAGETSFTFAAAGDYGSAAPGSTANDNIANLKSKNAALSFVIALGDLSYGDQSTQEWCSDFKALENNVELVSGNHDDGDIDAYVQNCPFTLGTANGDYGTRYNFDYPASSPIARFILITPNVFGSYSQGDPDYNFVSETIDSARTAGISWVIVGMHKVCITAGSKSCEIGSDLMSLLLDKKADLVLAGHDHTYQRSKQLTCAQVDSFDQSCVRAEGSSFSKGAGTIFVISGTGGQGEYSIDSSDPEYPYFQATNDDTHGFSVFTLSASSMGMSFLPSDGSFTDSFTIDGTPPPPGTDIPSIFNAIPTVLWLALAAALLTGVASFVLLRSKPRRPRTRA